jgi:hypothetical protein
MGLDVTCFNSLASRIEALANYTNPMVNTGAEN